MAIDLERRLLGPRFGEEAEGWELKAFWMLA
jgi:hypothetical protein